MAVLGGKRKALIGEILLALKRKVALPLFNCPEGSVASASALDLLHLETV